MTKDEALDMALEALLVDRYHSSDRIKREFKNEAIKAIRQTLAEPSEGIKSRREVIDHLEAVRQERKIALGIKK